MTSAASAPRPWTAIVCGAPDESTLLVVDWLLLAARTAGLLARAVPLAEGPGQPYGMYVEIASADTDALLTGMPWGGVDLLVAGEHGQLARALAAGYASPAVTTIVASCARSYTAAERAGLLDAVTRESQVDIAARRASRRYVAFDTVEVSRWYRLPAAGQTGLLFGAVFGSGLLGVERSACRRAIEQLGIDVATNLRSFRRGERFGRRDGARVRRRLTAAQFVRRRRGQLPWSERDAFESLVRRVDELFAEPQRDAVRAAIYELADFHDAEYAERLLEHCVLVRRAEVAHTPDIDPDASVVPEVARNLAAIMAYHDLPRIAQLKLRAARLRALRTASGADRDALVDVTDYLPLDDAELQHVARAAHLREQRSVPAGVGDARVVAVRTTSLGGALRLRRWRRLRARRADSARHRLELDSAAAYVAAVVDTLEVEPALATLVAQSGGLLRGAGVARAAARVTATTFWGSVVRQTLSIDRARPAGCADSIAALVVPHVWQRMAQHGTLALWDDAHHVVGIAMQHARGGAWSDAWAFARQLCGLPPQQPAVTAAPAPTAEVRPTTATQTAAVS